MVLLLVVALVIRFPLEYDVMSLGEGEESWWVKACVLCLPPLASVFGAFAAGITLRNSAVEEELHRRRLQLLAANLQAELETIDAEGDGLREHVNEVYRKAFDQVEAQRRLAIAKCVSRLVQEQGQGVLTCGWLASALMADKGVCPAALKDVVLQGTGDANRAVSANQVD